MVVTPGGTVHDELPGVVTFTVSAELEKLSPDKLSRAAMKKCEVRVWGSREMGYTSVTKPLQNTEARYKHDVTFIG